MKTWHWIIILLIVVAVVLFVFKDKIFKTQSKPVAPAKNTKDDNYKWLLENWQSLQKIGNLNDPPQKGFTTSTYDAANEDQKKIIDKNSFEWLENIASFARARGQKMADAIKESAYA